MILNQLYILIFKKYRNYSVVIFFFLFMFIPLINNFIISNNMNYILEQNKNTQLEIMKTSKLQKYWNRKNFKLEARKLKTIVSLNKTKTYRISSKKLIIIYKNLLYKDVNKIINALINKPFQIIKLVINYKSNKNIFSMEIECKW